MGIDPNNPDPIKKLHKEKETKIQILKKKLKTLESQHIQTLELIPLQSEIDDFSKDMVKFKEWVIECYDQIAKYKRKMSLV